MCNRKNVKIIEQYITWCIVHAKHTFTSYDCFSQSIDFLIEVNARTILSDEEFLDLLRAYGRFMSTDLSVVEIDETIPNELYRHFLKLSGLNNALDSKLIGRKKFETTMARCYDATKWDNN